MAWRHSSQEVRSDLCLRPASAVGPPPDRSRQSERPLPMAIQGSVDADRLGAGGSGTHAHDDAQGIAPGRFPPPVLGYTIHNLANEVRLRRRDERDGGSHLLPVGCRKP